MSAVNAAPMSGAYCSLDQVLQLRYSVRGLQFARRKNALSLLAGSSHTRFRGRGLEFEEVRHYQAGDDIRTIDWRVTARSGKAHTKLFREEREQPIIMLIDQRQPMFFGSQLRFKSVLAAYLAGLIGWATIGTGDRVGGLILGNEDHVDIRPGRNRKTLLQLFNRLCEFNQKLSGGAKAEQFSLTQALDELRRIARPGSTVMFISDFHDFEGDCEKQLHLLAKHCNLQGFFIADPLEMKLPPPGTYGISDGKQQSQLMTGSTDLRKAYSEAFNSRQQTVFDAFARLRAPIMPVLTSEDVLDQLQPFYAGRASGREKTTAAAGS